MNSGSNGLRIGHIGLLELSLEGLSVSLESVQPSRRSNTMAKLELSTNILIVGRKYRYSEGQLILGHYWYFEYLQGYNFWEYEFSPHKNNFILQHRHTGKILFYTRLILMSYHRVTSLQILSFFRLSDIVQGHNYWIIESRPYNHNIVSSGFDYQTDQIERYINSHLILYYLDFLKFLLLIYNIMKQVERRRFKELEEQLHGENEQMKHEGGKYETKSHILTSRCMINANYHVLPSLRHCAPPSSPPTGPSTGSPTSPPTGPSTGPPTSPPTGPSTGSPTALRGANSEHRSYADCMETLGSQRRNDE